MANVHDFHSGTNHMLHFGEIGDTTMFGDAPKSYELGDFIQWAGPPSDKAFDPKQLLEWQHAQFPAAHQDKFQFLSTLITGLSTDESSSFLLSSKYGLPPVYTDSQHFKWTSVNFGRGLMNPEPEEGIARTLRQSRSSDQVSLMRWGIAWYAEHGYLYTQEGQRNFYLQVRAIELAVRSTYELSVLIAVMNCRDKVYNYEIANNMRFTGKDWVALAEERNDSFIRAQKEFGGVHTAVDIGRTVLKKRGLTPTCIWTPHDGRMYWKNTNFEDNSYYKNGPAGPAAERRNELNVTDFEGLPLCVLEEYQFDRNVGLPLNPLETFEIIGQYNTLFGKDPKLIDLETYKSSHRDIKIFDFRDDRFRTITLLECIERSGVFENEDITPGPSPGTPGLRPIAPPDTNDYSVHDVFGTWYRTSEPTGRPPQGHFQLQNPADGSKPGDWHYDFARTWGQMFRRFTGHDLFETMATKIHQRFPGNNGRDALERVLQFQSVVPPDPSWARDAFPEKFPAGAPLARAADLLADAQGEALYAGYFHTKQDPDRIPKNLAPNVQRLRAAGEADMATHVENEIREVSGSSRTTVGHGRGDYGLGAPMSAHEIAQSTIDHLNEKHPSIVKLYETSTKAIKGLPRAQDFAAAAHQHLKSGADAQPLFNTLSQLDSNAGLAKSNAGKEVLTRVMDEYLNSRGGTEGPMMSSLTSSDVPASSSLDPDSAQEPEYEPGYRVEIHSGKEWKRLMELGHPMAFHSINDRRPATSIAEARIDPRNLIHNLFQTRIGNGYSISGLANDETRGGTSGNMSSANITYRPAPGPREGVAIPRGQPVQYDDYSCAELQYHASHAVNITNPEIRAIYVNLLMCDINMKCIRWLISNDIPCPIGALVFRPWMQVLTSSAILGAFGSQFGFFAIGPQDTMYGNDPDIKAHRFHYTAYHSPIILRPECIYYMDHLFMHDFYSGHNTEWMEPGDIDTLREAHWQVPDIVHGMDMSNHPSIFPALTLYCDPHLKSTVDLRGKWRTESLKDAGRPHFITTQKFYKDWAFKTNSEYRHPFAPIRPKSTNFRCSRALQLMFNPTTLMYNLSNVPKDGFGANIYSGCVKVLKQKSTTNGGVLEKQVRPVQED